MAAMAQISDERKYWQNLQFLMICQNFPTKQLMWCQPQI